MWWPALFRSAMSARSRTTSWCLHRGRRPAGSGKRTGPQHSVGLKTVVDAERIRFRLLGAFEHAESERDAEEVQRLLTFVVVGGGATGVELAASIRTLASDTLPA